MRGTWRSPTCWTGRLSPSASCPSSPAPPCYIRCCAAAVGCGLRSRRCPGAQPGLHARGRPRLLYALTAAAVAMSGPALCAQRRSFAVFSIDCLHGSILRPMTRAAVSPPRAVHPGFAIRTRRRPTIVTLPVDSTRDGSSAVAVKYASLLFLPTIAALCGDRRRCPSRRAGRQLSRGLLLPVLDRCRSRRGASSLAGADAWAGVRLRRPTARAAGTDQRAGSPVGM